jgi:transcriptional regulator with XRE-family HTH domain
MNQTLKPFGEALADLTSDYRLRAHQLRAAGHKQEYIAAVLGVSQGTLSRWLRGVRQVDERRRNAA